MAKRPANALDGIAPQNDDSTIKIELKELEIFKGELGRGSQGIVFKAYHPVFGVVAFKMKGTTLEQLSQRERGEMTNSQFSRITIAQRHENRELRFTSQVDNNPYILKFLAYVVDKGEVKGMLLEYMAQGSVYQALHRPDVLTMERIKMWLLQLARALMHCHVIHKVVHRDIKVEKCDLLDSHQYFEYFSALLSEDFNQLKLCDFGFARNVDPGKMSVREPKSLCIAAPETMGNDDYGFPCDVYSFGMFIYTVLNREYPFMERWNSSGQLRPTKSNYALNENFGLTTNEVQTFSITQHFISFCKFLSAHKDGEEDKYRPAIKRKEWKEFYCRDDFFKEQYENDQDILIWLMKKCWRTEPQNRPNIRDIVSLLDFHFASSIRLSVEREGRKIKAIQLLNENCYPIAFKIRPDNNRCLYDFKIDKGTLQSMEQINLNFGGIDADYDIHIPVEYIKIDEEIYLKELERRLTPEIRQVLKNKETYKEKCWEQRKCSDADIFFLATTEAQRTGKEPGKVGFVKLGVQEINVYY